MSDPSYPREQPELPEPVNPEPDTEVRTTPVAAEPPAAPVATPVDAPVAAAPLAAGPPPNRFSRRGAVLPFALGGVVGIFLGVLLTVATLAILHLAFMHGGRHDGPRHGQWDERPSIRQDNGGPGNRMPR